MQHLLCKQTLNLTSGLKDTMAGTIAISFFERFYMYCHDRDIPPQPSHTYSCLLTVQTPPEQSLTKPEPIPGLPDPSTAFPNPSAAFPKGCCTDVCLVSIPKAVNTIPEHIWPFLTNLKHLESHQPTLSLYTHLWTRRLSMRNRDQVKPKRLAVFPIESYSFPFVLIIICLSLPLSRSSCHSFPPSTLYPSSLYHTLSYPYTPCHYHLRPHPDHSFQVPVSSTT